MPPDGRDSARILILHPPVSVARDFIDYPYFSNLGAVQLAAVVRERGFEVVLVDAFALPGSTLKWREDGRAHLGAGVEEVLEVAASRGPYAAIACAYTPFHRPPHRDDVLARVLGGLRPLAPVLLLADCYQSGQHYVEAGDEVLRAYPEAEAWVKYEAEETVPDLLERLVQHGEAPWGVVRGARPQKLDALPFPAWELIDLRAFDHFRSEVVAKLGRGAWPFPIDGRTLPMVTSRGCPFTCIHCSSNPGRERGEPKTQRRYSAERLRAYLRRLAAYGVTRLEILDELVNVNERHFDVLLEEIAELGLKFDCPNGMRADYLEARHLDLMRGRVNQVSVSAESGDQRVVNEVVKKQLDLGAIERAAREAHRAGVPLMIHYMIGLPGESAAEMNRTLRFSMELWDRYRAWPAVQYATPLPGTELARDRLLPVVQDWGPAFQKAPTQAQGELLRAMLASLHQRLDASQQPPRVSLNATFSCNNRCVFCAVADAPAHGSRDFKQAILKNRQNGAEEIEFEGGEPTLHPELVGLVGYARHLGYRQVAMTTNGRAAFYERYAQRLVQSGVTSLQFSLHAVDAATHGALTGVEEAFEQTVQGIRNCVAHRPRGVELGLSVAVTRTNQAQLSRLGALAFDLGLERMDVQFLTPFGAATPELAPEKVQALDETKRVIERWGTRLRIRVLNLPRCELPGYEAFVAEDLRKVVRINAEQVDHATYLASRRVRKPACETCPHAIACEGFHELSAAPEPPWRADETPVRLRVPSRS